MNTTYTGKRYVSHKILLATPHEVSKSEWLDNYDKYGKIYFALYDNVSNMEDDVTVYAIAMIGIIDVLSKADVVDMMYNAESINVTEIIE